MFVRSLFMPSFYYALPNFYLWEQTDGGVHGRSCNPMPSANRASTNRLDAASTPLLAAAAINAAQVKNAEYWNGTMWKSVPTLTFASVKHRRNRVIHRALNELLHITEFLYVFQPRLLTMSVFTMAHLKVDASVEFSGDQSVGHNHHQPRDCKQHEQQQDVPEGDTLQVSVDFHWTPLNGVIIRKKL